MRHAVPGGTDTSARVTSAFRNSILADTSILRYGAAYFPYLDTSLDILTSDDKVTIAAHHLLKVADDGTETPGTGSLAAGTPLSHPLVLGEGSGIHEAVRSFIRHNAKACLPPSGAIAGIYARVDAERGVWKAPANVSLALVEQPAIPVAQDFNEALNVDVASGKSVNAIRAFAGKGTLVWGARTLAGNDNEWRSIPVRRFCSFVEESLQKAIRAFAFEPNETVTWNQVRAMAENFLVQQWRSGALAGTHPNEAFYVRVGLNQTMTSDDILDGRMIIDIGLSVVRPAEFIVLRLVQKMRVV